MKVKSSMHYELSHDAIALQVHDKAGAEARARRKAERYLAEHYETWQERGVPLNQDDIDFLRPFLDSVNSPEEELAFVRKSMRILKRQRQLRLWLLTLTSLAFALLAIWGQLQRRSAQQREAQSRAMRTSLAAQYALHQGQPRLAFRLAEQSLLWNTDTAASRIASDVLGELKLNPLMRDLTHQDTITAMQFNGNGELMLTASLDGEVRITDLAGKTTASYRYQDGVHWTTWVLNDKGVVSLLNNGKLYLWNLATNQHLELPADEPLQQARLATDGHTVHAAGERKVYRWDLRRKTAPLQVWTLPDRIRAFTIWSSKDAYTLIAALANGQFGQWHETGELAQAYPKLVKAPITALDVDASAAYLVTQTTAGDFLLSTTGDSLSFRTALAFQGYQPRHTSATASTDPNRLVSISRDSNLAYVWNIGDQQRDIDLQWSPRGLVRFVLLSANGHRLVAGSTDNEVVVKQLKQDQNDQNIELYRFSNHLKWGVFAPNHAHFLSTAGGKEALLWKFDDSTFVDIKKRLTNEELLEYYDLCTQPLSSQERWLYQLD